LKILLCRFYNSNSSVFFLNNSSNCLFYFFNYYCSSSNSKILDCNSFYRVSMSFTAQWSSSSRSF